RRRAVDVPAVGSRRRRQRRSRDDARQSARRRRAPCAEDAAAHVARGHGGALHDGRRRRLGRPARARPRARAARRARGVHLRGARQRAVRRRVDGGPCCRRRRGYGCAAPRHARAQFSRSEMTANLTPADAAVRARSVARRHGALRAWLAENDAEALVAYGSGHHAFTGTNPAWYASAYKQLGPHMAVILPRSGEPLAILTPTWDAARYRERATMEFVAVQPEEFLSV